MSRNLNFAVTFEIVTQESAENGDYEEIGYIDQNLNLRDAIEEVQKTRTNEVDGVQSIELDCSMIDQARSITITNSMEYITGANESRTIHFPKNLTTSTKRRIAKILGVRNI